MAQDAAPPKDAAPPNELQADVITNAPPIFVVEALECVGGGDSAATCRARAGVLFSSLKTPRCTLLTSRSMPLQLHPEACGALYKSEPQLVQLPFGDLLLQQDTVAQSPHAATGCSTFWPHLKGQFTYCSFRNPRLKESVYGGDAVCRVETTGGRRKVGAQELLDLQRVMRAKVVAAPGEEVPVEVTAPRRLQRAVTRAGEWLKKIVEAKSSEAELGFDWHVLASIQGGGDNALRREACQSAVAQRGVAGVWIGGLGYGESLETRARILEACAAELPPTMPRFLPLNEGTPEEVLQAVLHGVDVLEISYPVQIALQGFALTFSCEMPSLGERCGGGDDSVNVASLQPPVEKVCDDARVTITDEADEAERPPKVAQQIQLRLPEYAEDFGPVCEDSPMRQYSRAYIHHLFDVWEMLGTQLLVKHNLHVYQKLFDAIREHIQRGSIDRFAEWFLRTQMVDPPAALPEGPTRKKRKRD